MSHEPLSTKLWGIDWKKHFPLTLAKGEVRVEYSTYDEAMSFMRGHFGEIYAEIRSELFLDGGDNPQAKERFYRAAADFFLFKHGDSPVGLGLGNPLDWSSYNLRNISILADYRGGGNYQTFFKHLCDALAQAGVERLEGHVAPTNFPHIHALNKMGMTVTGVELSERWGSLLHFTMFLSEKHEATFHRQFCHVVNRMSG